MPIRPNARGKRLSTNEVAALRLAARSAYTLEPEPLTLEELVCRPAFRNLGLARLRRWSQEEDWDAQRACKADSWQRQAEARVRQTQRKVDDWHLRTLQSLHDEALRLRCNPRVQPRSWEAVAAVQLRVAQTLRDWKREDEHSRRRDADERPATLNGREQPQQEKPSVGAIPEGALEDITDEEYQESAHHILRRRLGVSEEDKNEVREPVKPGKDKTELRELGKPRLVRSNG